MSDILYRKSAINGLIEAKNELIAMTEQLDELREGIDYASGQLTKVKEQRDEALSDLEFRRDLYKLQSQQLTAVTEQRDRLAEALMMITTFDYTDLQCDNGHGPRSVATEALQSLNKPTETKTK